MATGKGLSKIGGEETPGDPEQVKVGPNRSKEKGFLPTKAIALIEEAIQEINFGNDSYSDGSGPGGSHSEIFAKKMAVNKLRSALVFLRK